MIETCFNHLVEPRCNLLKQNPTNKLYSSSLSFIHTLFYSLFTANELTYTLNPPGICFTQLYCENNENNHNFRKSLGNWYILKICISAIIYATYLVLGLNCHKFILLKFINGNIFCKTNCSRDIVKSLRNCQIFVSKWRSTWRAMAPRGRKLGFYVTVPTPTTYQKIRTTRPFAQQPCIF